MAVFISYSQQNLDFVETLATRLLAERIHLWLDRWELKVGDSLLTRIQRAITDADFLCVVLSKASVESEWCKTELHAAMTRELAEKKVIVLPIYIEDCEIPLFLRDKLYADFRKNFDTGFRDLVAALAPVTTPYLGRIKGPEYTIDTSVSWGEFNGKDLFVKIVGLYIYPNEDFSLLTTITMIANAAATAQYKKYEQHGFGWLTIETLLTMLFDLAKTQDLRMAVSDNMPVTQHFGFQDPKRKFKAQVEIVGQLLGNNQTFTKIYSINEFLQKIEESRKSRIPKLSPEQQKILMKLQS